MTCHANVTKQDKLTHSLLLDRLHYNTDTGDFIWKNGPRAGKLAGDVKKDGYRYIALINERYLAHRLAWFYVHGRWPEPQIDHLNRNGADNRLVNLREVTAKGNCENRPLSGACLHRKLKSLNS